MQRVSDEIAMQKLIHIFVRCRTNIAIARDAEAAEAEPSRNKLLGTIVSSAYSVIFSSTYLKALIDSSRFPD